MNTLSLRALKFPPLFKPFVKRQLPKLVNTFSLRALQPRPVAKFGLFVYMFKLFLYLWSFASYSRLNHKMQIKYAVWLHFLYAVLQLKKDAEDTCSLIKSDIFKECYSVADYGYYYKKCMTDYCLSGGNSEIHVCTHAAALARDCALQGKEILWRNDQRAALKCRKCLYSFIGWFYTLLFYWIKYCSYRWIRYKHCFKIFLYTKVFLQMVSIIRIQPPWLVLLAFGVVCYQCKMTSN